MKKFPAHLITLALVLLGTACKTEMEAPVKAPFTGLDTICTNDWWNAGSQSHSQREGGSRPGGGLRNVYRRPTTS